MTVETQQDKKERAANRNRRVSKELDSFLGAINKKHKAEDGKEMAVVYSDKGPETIRTFSSGSLVLDAIVGGGMPEGRIIEIWGLPGSGKTSIALTTLGNVQRDPEARATAFFDFEFALDPSYAKTLGVDMDSMVYVTPQYMEEGLQMLEEFAASGLFSYIVVDSVASMVPKSEWEGELEDQTMGLVARVLSRSLRKLAGTCHRNGVTVCFINQTREKIGFVMGNPMTTPGGKALGFYASQRISVRRAEKVTENGELIGYKLVLTVEKNKIGKPGGKGETLLTFDRGISRAAEIIDDEVGVRYGVVSKKGSTITEVSTGERIGIGKSKAIAFLESNPEIMERLSDTLAEKLNEAESMRTAPAQVLEAETAAEELDGDEI